MIKLIIYKFWRKKNRPPNIFSCNCDFVAPLAPARSIASAAEIENGEKNVDSPSLPTFSNKRRAKSVWISDILWSPETTIAAKIDNKEAAVEKRMSLTIWKKSGACLIKIKDHIGMTANYAHFFVNNRINLINGYPLRIPSPCHVRQSKSNSSTRLRSRYFFRFQRLLIN